MNPRWILSLAAAIIVALASPVFAAAPLTLERHEQAVERVAPRFPTVPGRTLCVCQTAANSGATFVGYLNSYPVNSAGDQTVNMVCAYPVFTPGVGTGFCSIFQVIK